MVNTAHLTANTNEEKVHVPLIMYINFYRGVLRGVKEGLDVLTGSNPLQTASASDVEKILAGIRLAQESYAHNVKSDRAAEAGIPSSLKEWIDSYTAQSGVPPLAATVAERELKSHVSTEAGFAANDIYRKLRDTRPELADKPMDEIVESVVYGLDKLHADLQEKEKKAAVIGRIAGGKALAGFMPGR